MKGLFEIGMIAKRGKPWMACSPDGIAVIDLNNLPVFTPHQNCQSETQLSSSETPQYNKLPALEGCCVLCSVEIKTSVATSSLERSIQLASVDVKVCRVGDITFRTLFPEAHIGQILHQMLVLRINHVMYVAAAETGITFIVIAYCDVHILSVCELALEQAAEDCVAWAQEESMSMPSIQDAELSKVIYSRLPFWRLVNSYVLENSAFYPPVKLFRHGVQTLYSKTKGGVDGSAQARAILRSPTSSLKWEQKVVTQTLKTLAVNAFVAWRMRQKKSLLENKESFQNLEYYRGCLNAVQSLADFVLDASRELIERADVREMEIHRGVDASVTGGMISSDISGDEGARLRAEAKLRKRYRLPFFNSADGVKLRLLVAGHETRHSDSERYCALCGNSGKSTRWRGHRSSFHCPSCDVHLCVRLHQGFRKNCWTIWHSQRRLEPRVTYPPSNDAGNDPVTSEPETRSIGTVRVSTEAPSENSRPARRQRLSDDGQNDS